MSILNNFTNFALNYPPLFCLKIWNDNPHMANHLNGKFNECYERYGALGAMTAFYNSLDATNSEIFENYLTNSNE
tara:strand:+ start:1080 stop:1304 length:225 start_codon:yes stop_codon:yes gene_type:complete